MQITLTGPNDYALQAELQKLTADFIKKYGTMAVERLDGEEDDFERLQEGLLGLPFLASNKLAILRAPSANKTFTEKIEQIFDSIPDTTVAIFVEQRLDKRTSYYKMLKKRTGFHEFLIPDEQELTAWLVAEAKHYGGKLSGADARLLVDKIGPNQMQLKSELDKLLLYDPNVSRAGIEELVEANPRSTVFELLDAAFAGQAQRATKIYQEQRRLRVEPQAIMGMIAWQLHVMALIKTAPERNPAAIAKATGLHPFVVRKNLNITDKITLNQLREIVAEAHHLDIALKSQPIDPDEAMLLFLLSLGNN